MPFDNVIPSFGMRDTTTPVPTCYCFLETKTLLTINTSGPYYDTSKIKVTWCLSVDSKVRCKKGRITETPQNQPCYHPGSATPTPSSLRTIRICRWKCMQCGSDTVNPRNCGRVHTLRENEPGPLCKSSSECSSKDYDDCPGPIKKIVDRMREAERLGGLAGGYILEDLPGAIVGKEDRHVGGTLNDLLPKACKDEWPHEEPSCDDIEKVCREITHGNI